MSVWQPSATPLPTAQIPLVRINAPHVLLATLDTVWGVLLWFIGPYCIYNALSPLWQDHRVGWWIPQIQVFSVDFQLCFALIAFIYIPGDLMRDYSGAGCININECDDNNGGCDVLVGGHFGSIIWCFGISVTLHCFASTISFLLNTCVSLWIFILANLWNYFYDYQ